MEDTIKFLPLGGQDEIGKSMYCLEINNKIFIIDCGFKFPEVDKLGVDIIIPSYQYLIENKKNISAILITHGHDDVMAGLPYLLREIPGIPVYASSLTCQIVEQTIRRYERHRKVDLELDLHVVKSNGYVIIDNVRIDFFPVTHSIPGSIGLAFLTDYGYIVYSSEFIIDFGAPEGFQSDIQRMMSIADKGVLALLVESSYAGKEGYTSPNHKLTPKIETTFEDAGGRIIISSYAQNVFRTKEIIELTKKYHRKIVFYGYDRYDNTNTIMRLNKHNNKPILDIDNRIVESKESVGDKRKDSNYVVLLSGNSHQIYSDISDIIDGGDSRLKIRSGDTFIVASPVLPGTEKIATTAHNNLYRTDAKVVLLKNKDLYSMHASSEDIRVLIQLFHPKYYIPIKGQFKDFVANGHIGESMGIDKENIIFIDNGEQLLIEDGTILPDRNIIDLEDVMIDGIGIGDVGDKVIYDRMQLAKDGIVMVGLTIDARTKKIVAQTDCQTRGFVYLKDFGYVIKEIINICEDELNDYIQHPTKEVAEIRNAMRDRCMKYIISETGKRPVFMCVIIEV